MDELGSDRASAVMQFRRARRKAELEAILSKLTGGQEDLLVFDEIRKKLALTNPKPEKLKNIPLDAIVGTVSRYYDFNRQFYPLADSDENRWAKVKQLVEVTGLDPIEVYQVGEIYFVLDGNHRVSVARQLKSEMIQAYVKEFRTQVEVTSEDDIEDIVLRAEYLELMEDTKLDKVRPDVEFKVTVTGRYEKIKEHIAVHRYYMGVEQEREISMEEAAASWVDQYYLPGVEVIREQNILADFPGRTETDLYLWLKKHQWELEEALERDIPDSDAAQDLTVRFGERFWRRITRLWSKFWKQNG